MGRCGLVGMHPCGQFRGKVDKLRKQIAGHVGAGGALDLDEARAEMRKSSREEVKKLEKEEKDHASFQKLFTGAASVVGFILLLFTVGAFRRSNG